MIEKFLQELENPEVEAFLSVLIINLIKKTMENKPLNLKEINTEKIDKQPLFLPHGSIRAIITFTLLLVSSGSFIFHYTLPQEFYAVTILAIGYYIGYRTNNTQLPKIYN